MFYAIDFILRANLCNGKISKGMFRKNKNIKLFFKFILVPLLAMWLFYSLYRQIRNQPDLSGSWQLIKNAPFGQQAWKFGLAFILIFANWGIEAVKWRLLMLPLERISFIRAFKSVLSGVTLSVNTPNRLGEYGGRVLYISAGKRLKSIPLSVAGSISQLTVTTCMGSIASFYILLKILGPEQGMLGISHTWLGGLAIISVFASCSLIIFFLKIPFIIKLTKTMWIGKKISPYTSALGQVRIKLLLTLLLLSLFRYFIFIFQYLLLLQTMNVGIRWQWSVALIALLFFLLAIVPSFAIADLGIRGQLGIALFGIYSNNTLGIIGATFGIWVLNLFIPALAGSIMILSIKFFKEKKI
jgi:hypothetical protein